MLSITEALRQIKNAVLGRDVRTAIHDGIQQCYNYNTDIKEDLLTAVTKFKTLTQTQTVHSSAQTGPSPTYMAMATFSVPEGSTAVEASYYVASNGGYWSKENLTVSTAGTTISALLNPAAADTDYLFRLVYNVNNPDIISHEDELEDIRVGEDGTEYSTAGEAVRTQIGDLKDDLTQDINDVRTASGVNLFNPDALIENTFLNGTTGLPESNNNYWASDFIPVNGTYTVRAFEYSGSARTRVYMYDSNKEYDHRAIQPPESFPNGYTFTWTGYVRLSLDNGKNNAYENPEKYMLVSGSSSGGVASEYIPYYTAYDRTARSDITKALKTVNVNHTSNYTFTDLNEINDNSVYYVSPSRVTGNYPPNLGAAYVETTKLNTENKMQIAYSAYGTRAYIRACVSGAWGEWTEITLGGSYSEAVTKSEFYETSTIALFPSVGCCGDSFTAGYLYNKEDSVHYDPDYVPNGEYPAIGYPAVMGRLYGTEVTAYAKGGLTSTAYRTDAKGLPALLADEPKYLYIIALGLNDKTQNVPLGVEADIDTEPSTPTYLGNMGAIIRAIQSHAPYARIILCKSLWMNNDYYNYISGGIELLSSHLGIPYLETKGDPYFESSAYKNGLKGLHPTAPLYAGIGKRIGEKVGKCVLDNPSYFYNFYVPNN